MNRFTRDWRNPFEMRLSFLTILYVLFLVLLQQVFIVLQIEKWTCVCIDSPTETM
jgi:hypothetical protein